jgi:phosphonate transport system substrate-binding protein
MFSLPSYAAELMIGLIPELNVFKQVRRYEPIGKYIMKKTGIEVKFTILSRYGNIINNFEAHKLDGAFWGSFTGALANEKLGIEYIARPLWNDGTSTYHGYIFARKNSGIESVSDMKGRSIAFVEQSTTAGYVFPLSYFKEQGVTSIETFFEDYFFAGSHDAAISAVLLRQADIGCAKNTIYDMMARDNPRINEELFVIARSPLVPSNALGVRNDLDASVKEQLRDVFLGMDKDKEGKKVLEQFGAKSFIRTTADDYKPVLDIAERAGINLKKYQYYNQ